MLVLASSSPRRIELLKTICANFIIDKPLFDESIIAKDESNYALKESLGKGKSIIGKYSSDDCIISCDTIVFLNGKIYGKPKDLVEAKVFLSELSNNTHYVISGYSIFYKNKIISKEIKTAVTFNNLTNEMIENYISKENVLDKAGAYAIQDDEKFHLISKIKGSYTNVIGFPIESIKHDLEKLNII